jgi:hypothetical protein
MKRGREENRSEISKIVAEEVKAKETSDNHVVPIIWGEI